MQNQMNKLSKIEKSGGLPYSTEKRVRLGLREVRSK